MKSNRGTSSSGPLILRAAAALVPLLLLATMAPGEAVADQDGEYRMISDEWVLNLGGYLSDFNTTAAVGTESLIGTVVRLEDELGLAQDKSFFRMDGLYRFNERHALGFGYWGLKRDGQQTVSDSITWQGIVYDVGVTIDSTFDLSWVRADWRYSFLHTERGEAGLVLGLSTYDLSASLEGDGMINMSPVGRVRGEETLFAPVPTYGIFVNFGITRTILFHANMSFLDLSLSDVDGKVVDLLFTIDWYPTKHFGFGGGTARTTLEYEDTSSDPINIDYKQSGFVGYVTFVWGDLD